MTYPRHLGIGYRVGDVVYCDPPYAKTASYGEIKFDTAAFWDWVRSRPCPVFVSEYHEPEDFVSIWSKDVCRLANQFGSDGKATEHVFLHRRYADGFNTTTRESVQLELAL